TSGPAPGERAARWWPAGPPARAGRPAAAPRSRAVASVLGDSDVAEPEEPEDPRVLEAPEPGLPHPVVGEVPEAHRRALPLEDGIRFLVHLLPLGLVELAGRRARQLRERLVLPVGVEPVLFDQRVVPVRRVLVVGPPATAGVDVERGGLPTRPPG